MTTTSAPRPGRPRLGEILVAAGVLEESSLQAALAEQRKWGDRLGRTLVHMGLLSEDDLAQALSRQLRLPTCRPDVAPLPIDVTDHLGVLACERYGVMPLGIENGVLRVATSDPSNELLLEELGTVVGLRVEPVIATESAIGLAIRKHYYGESIDPNAGLPAMPFLETPEIELPIDLTPGPFPEGRMPLDPAQAPNARSIPPAEVPWYAISTRPVGASPGAGGVPTAEAARSPADPDPIGGHRDLKAERTPEADLALREAVERLENDLALEIRALRGLVETLIERGLITREEFLAHVRSR